MAETYATVSDLQTLWRALSASEQAMAEQLLPMVSAEIREKARQLGRDFDQMLEDNEDLPAVARSVCCDVVRRYMNDLGTDGPAMSQMSQSAGSYSISGTFLTPGGGLFLKKTELSRLGLRRQRYGVIEF